MMVVYVFIETSGHASVMYLLHNVLLLWEDEATTNKDANSWFATW